MKFKAAKLIGLVGAIILTLVTLYAVYVYATHFWYKEPQYSVGVKNMTPLTIDNVVLTLKPEGEFSCGILSANNFKRHMDPRWPLPEELILRFTDEAETEHYEFRKKVSIPKDFRGDLTAEIMKTGKDFTFDLKQERRAN